jgi:chaperonin GroEL
MAAKRILFGEAGRARLLEGARVLAGAVAPTLGPAGRNVLLQRPAFNAPLLTKDGVTVAEEIELADAFENMGAQLVIEGSAQTSLVVGDGTTTAALLAYAIYREGTRLVAAGHHPIELKRGIDLAVERVVVAVGKMSKPLVGKDHIIQVATLSANGDPAIGELIARAVEQVGREGIIHLEQGRGLETTLEVAEGTEVERGFLSAYFITEPERLVAELEDPYILLSEQKISRVQELLPILQKVGGAGRSLLIVAEVTGDALSMLVVNKIQGTLKVCAILPPSHGDWRKEMLGDLAAQTGGRAVTQDPELTLEHVTLDDLGRAQRVVVEREKTTIIGGAARRPEVAARTREIRAQHEATRSTFEHQRLDARLRKLVGGAALVRVGGTTEVDLRERKARLEDALFATRAAIEEGIVPGGGVALLRASSTIARLEKDLSAELAAGIAIVRRACEEPCRRIAENAGREGSVVVQRVREGKGAFGYDAARDCFGDLVQTGVIDPAKVVRLALQNAASVATMLLTAEAFIADAPRAPAELLIGGGSSHDALSLDPFRPRR